MSHAAFVRSTLTLTLLLPVLGCGSTQESGDGGCGPVLAGQSTEEASSRIACFADRPALEAAAGCRGATDHATSLAPEQLGAAVKLVLGAKVREDGAWVAGVLGAVAEDKERAAAVAQAMFGSFDFAVHGNSFAAAVGTPGQTALGAQLTAAPEGFASQLVSLGLSSGLTGLVAAAPAVVEKMEATDPGLVSYAEQIAGSTEPKSASERSILVKTGKWSPGEIIRCFKRERPDCSAWEGASPLQLFSQVRVTQGRTASDLVGLMRSGQLDEASAKAVVTGVTTGEYPNRGAMTTSLLLDMTDTTVPEPMRRVIATTPSPGACTLDKVSSLFSRVRAVASHGDAKDGSIWESYVAACKPLWTLEELAGAVAAGSQLGVSEAFGQTLRAELKGRAGEVTCEATAAWVAASKDRMTASPMFAAVPAVALLVAPESCRGTLSAAVTTLVNDERAYGEARLAGVEAQLSAGDRRGCGKVASALAWRDSETHQGPGAWAESAAGRIRGLCR